MVGKTFNRLTVITEVGKSPEGILIWECTCLCGRTTRVLGTRLRSGHTKSCGCLVREVASRTAKLAGKRSAHKKRKAAGHSGRTYLLNHYKAGAKKRRLEWNLSPDLFGVLTSSSCHYCGALPKQVVTCGRNEDARNHSRYVFNGLDRVDSRRGYTPDNVVACCGDCNLIKSDWELGELFAHLKQMINHYGL